MKMVYAIIFMLCTSCIIQAITIPNLSFPITFGPPSPASITKPLYQWIAQERKRLFGKTFIFTYDAIKQKIVHVSDVRHITKEQIAIIGQGTASYTPVITTDNKNIRVDVDTIVAVAVDIGGIVIPINGTADDNILVTAAQEFYLDKLLD